MAALVTALASDPTSLLAREMGSDGWTRFDHLLALVVDALNAANWQRAGKKHVPKPKPISPLAKKGRRRYGKTDRSPAEVAAYLARFDPAQQAS